MKASEPTKPQKNMTPWVWTVVLLAVALAGYAIYAVISDNPGQNALSREITVTEASALQDQGAFILDVREPDEWADGHIAGATLIPLGQLETRLMELPKDQTIVVVCRTGNRSAQGRDILLSSGFSTVTSMGGGMSAWISQGLPVVSGP
jgi:rhodanese-related sulfurtransferase